MNNQLLALEGVSNSKIVADNLNAMHAARKGFKECEASEKLRRAVRHQVRTSITDLYKNGDFDLYKRNESDGWLGPGAIIGWEHKQVQVKHRATYVRVHPSRLSLYPDTHHDTSEPIKHHSKNNVITNSYVRIDDGNETDDNPEQYGANAYDKSPKIVTKFVQLPKPGQTKKCKFTNDEDHG